MVGALGTPAYCQEWSAEAGYTWSGPEFGRLGLVRNLHAYDQDGTALVPVRGFADLFGATASYADHQVILTPKGSYTNAAMRVGSRYATWGGNEHDMGAPLTVFSGIACAPVRSLDKVLGVTVEYEPYSLFGASPALAVTVSGVTRQLLVHLQPPDGVARFVADMEHTTQHDATIGDDFTIGVYGLDWIVAVGKLTSDGKHFTAPAIPMYDEKAPVGANGEDVPAFWTNAAGVYGIRNGRWRYLAGTQSHLEPSFCRDLGIPLTAAREMGLLYTPPPPRVSSESQAPATTWEPEVQWRLTPQNARVPAYIGDGYFVMSLNFRRLFDFSDRGSKVLGQIITPDFKETSKPIQAELSLCAYDVLGGMLGSSTIRLHSLPGKSTVVPFEAGLLDVSLAELGSVSIIPKGAWVPRD